jgi:hypothetical protein
MSYTVLVLNYNILSIIPFPELFTKEVSYYNFTYYHFCI